LLAPETLDLWKQAPALRFKGRQLLQLGGRIEAAIGKAPLDGFDVLSDEKRVEHN
jgi:hypothetical protein